MKLVAVQAAALGHGLWSRLSRADFWRALDCRPVEGVFPSLTCPAQATFRTALPVSGHGVVANGYFDRTLRKALFWEQSSRLCEGPRIWDAFRGSGGKVAQLCFQQSLGPDCDVLLSPAPIHKHHGGMIEDFASRPPGLYRSLCKKLGREFALMGYWGPFASAKSSRWIADAAVELVKEMSGGSALILVYLPHLDYDLQRFGPESPQAEAAFREAERLLERIFAAAKLNGFEFAVFGDYEISGVSEAAFPNRALLESGFLSVRDLKGMLYPDLHSSRAFALCDHQVAHVYVDAPGDIPKVKDALSGLPGVARIIERDADPSIRHPRAGELVLEAAPGRWFAYPWWRSRSEAPDYATHVDIHSKPGYDPCELFMSLWPPLSVSQDVSKIRGSHGRAGDRVIWGSTFPLRGESLLGCAEALRGILPGRA